MTAEAVTRRNDPCPCGSGKKFKKCCMSKNETFDNGVLYLLKQEFDRLNQGLFDYSQRNYRRSLDTFTKKVILSHSMSYSMRAVVKELLTIWGIFNLPVRGDLTPFDVYCEAYQNGTPRQSAIEMVTSWKKALFSVYSIQSISEDRLMSVTDIWTKETALVPVPTGNHAPALDSLLVGMRVSLIDDAQEFLLGYAEVEGSVWSEEKLNTLRNTYLNADAQRSIIEQVNEKMPEIFIKLIAPSSQASDQAEGHQEKVSTSEEAPSRVKSEKTPADQTDQLNDVKKADQEDNLTFSGNASQKEVLYILQQNAASDFLQSSALQTVFSLWNAYVAKHNPTIKKPEAYAAALDYYIGVDLNTGQATQAEISKKYGVSSSTVSKNYRLLHDFAEEIAPVPANV